MLVPKAEELVANPYRHGGKEGARKFFEDGFRERLRERSRTALTGLSRSPSSMHSSRAEADDDGEVVDWVGDACLKG